MARGLWQEIEDAVSGGYSFNKSHSTSYGVLSYKTAWLKCHYPVYWYASLLNSEIGDQSKVESLIAECKKKNIKILPPDINKGSYKFEGTKEGIRIPINYLKGIGEDVVKYIQKELVPISSFEDMLDRGIKKYIKKNVVMAMIKAGIFDFENENREHFMWVYNMRNRKKTDIKNGVECEHLPYDEKIKMQWERDVYGMYLSKHPLENYNVRSITDYTDDMVKGCIYLKRSDNTEYMSYINYNSFKSKLGEGKTEANVNDAKKYFSMDDDNNIVIVTWSKVSEKIECKNEEEQKDTTLQGAYSITEYKIDQ